MKKTIKAESFAKKYFTKNELRYMAANHDWAFVTVGMLPGGMHYKRRWYDSCTKVVEFTVTSQAQLAAIQKAMEKRVRELRKKMGEGTADEWCEREDARIAEEKRANKIKQQILDMFHADGSYSVFARIRTGENVDDYFYRWSDHNGVECREVTDWQGYGRGYKRPMIRRSFTLHIRKGWHLYVVGGLLTFVKGKAINRAGMVCEWVEQGRSIADLRTVKGYLVRGEHIEAKSLKEAQAINAERRAIQLARLLAARKKSIRRAQKYANIRITFQDSLHSGNCRPGTAAFKRKYEEVIGHEAQDISIADLRKYARQFGVEYYAERVINYVINH